MILGAVWYVTYIASFYYLNEALLYSASAMLGIGAALIWTAQVQRLCYFKDAPIAKIRLHLRVLSSP